MLDQCRRKGYVHEVQWSLVHSPRIPRSRPRPRLRVCPNAELRERCSSRPRSFGLGCSRGWWLRKLGSGWVRRRWGDRTPVEIQVRTTPRDPRAGPRQRQWQSEQQLPIDCVISWNLNLCNFFFKPLLPISCLILFRAYSQNLFTFQNIVQTL